MEEDGQKRLEKGSKGWIVGYTVARPKLTLSGRDLKQDMCEEGATTMTQSGQYEPTLLRTNTRVFFCLEAMSSIRLTRWARGSLASRTYSQMSAASREDWRSASEGSRRSGSSSSRSIGVTAALTFLVEADTALEDRVLIPSELVGSCSEEESSSFVSPSEAFDKVFLEDLRRAFSSSA